MLTFAVISVATVITIYVNVKVRAARRRRRRALTSALSASVAGMLDEYFGTYRTKSADELSLLRNRVEEILAGDQSADASFLQNLMVESGEPPRLAPGTHQYEFVAHAIGAVCARYNRQLQG